MVIAQIRCIAKVVNPDASPRSRIWRVYDTLRGCWPSEVPGYGCVRGARWINSPETATLLSEVQAQAEAERLNEFYAGAK